jgi:hypothetical protein
VEREAFYTRTLGYETLRVRFERSGMRPS